ncbi:MAG: peptidoglycan-binding protein [Myxococcales bacterium]|nr:peptidoglycan-binding protein [Myxococcales bacterium]
MPNLSATARRIIADGRITSSEVGELESSIRAGEAQRNEVASLASRYSDLFEPQARTAVVQLSSRLGEQVRLNQGVRSLGDDAQSAGVLRGEVVLSAEGGARHPAVLQFQRALCTLARRAGKAEWALAGHGADGAMGAETARAVKAFQRDHRLPQTGAIDADTALAIEAELLAHPPAREEWDARASALPDGEAIASAARSLIESRAEDYGTERPWRSPNPNVPGNREPGRTPIGAAGRWKCNLFGLDSLYLAGAKPPHYGGDRGWYPIAIDIPKYSRGPNAPLIKLGEVRFDDSNRDSARERVKALMRIARPGDILIVNHLGPDVADGGHTRVVVGNRFAEDGTLECAQAGGDRAMVRAESVDSLMSGEEGVYLLRPAQRR